MEYIEYPGVNHDSWTPAFNEKDFMEGFSTRESSESGLDKGNFQPVVCLLTVANTLSMKIDNQALVIFGASGDLTYRKLVPSVFDLYMNDSLPEGYAVLGVSRSKYTDAEFRRKMKEGIKQFSHFKNAAQRG